MNVSKGDQEDIIPANDRRDTTPTVSQQLNKLIHARSSSGLPKGGSSGNFTTNTAIAGIHRKFGNTPEKNPNPGKQVLPSFLINKGKQNMSFDVGHSRKLQSESFQMSNDGDLSVLRHRYCGSENFMSEETLLQDPCPEERKATKRSDSVSTSFTANHQPHYGSHERGNRYEEVLAATMGGGKRPVRERPSSAKPGSRPGHRRQESLTDRQGDKNTYTSLNQRKWVKF
eukprot:CAMPEP_0115025810 /NCGR_PEP_ID=MMETSP0216-20121206/34292_1 /TAXON_ID=223996 /ORGANISM="Protocruzia adherens, Strain Boccale" /LENGTH=227 /DNA_ID=CAMNT_0002400605 /DNA_START=151 /DNA_END=834 /DNA_ORIENTATION=+